MDLSGRRLTREELKTLPIEVLTAPRVSYGSLILLHMDHRRWTHKGRWNCALYASFVKYKRVYREAAGSRPLEAAFSERLIRRLWSRLVDRSSGYWLCIPATPSRLEELRAQWAPDPVGLVRYLE